MSKIKLLIPLKSLGSSLKPSLLYLLELKINTVNRGCYKKGRSNNKGECLLFFLFLFGFFYYSEYKADLVIFQVVVVVTLELTRTLSYSVFFLP